MVKAIYIHWYEINAGEVTVLYGFLYVNVIFVKPIKAIGARPIFKNLKAFEYPSTHRAGNGCSEAFLFFMIVRKYEERGGNHVEFWINDGKVYCMVTDCGDISLTCSMEFDDIKDLENWLFYAAKQIEPKQSTNE